MALFSTILPALIDRPAAMIEWIALARTALEVKNKHNSWPAAMHYIEGLLRERICTSNKEGFAKPSDSVLRDVTTAVKGHDHFFPPGNAQQRTAGGKQQQTGKCHDFQRNACTRSPCMFLHICAVCNGSHGATQNPACAKTHSAQRAGSGNSSGGKGGRRGGTQGRPPHGSTGAPNGASSVKTGTVA